MDVSDKGMEIGGERADDLYRQNRVYYIMCLLGL